MCSPANGHDMEMANIEHLISLNHWQHFVAMHHYEKCLVGKLQKEIWHNRPSNLSLLQRIKSESI